MKQSVFTVLENRSLAASVFRMRLRGCTEEIRQPGQFVNLSLPGFFLRRPISVCDVEDDVLTLIYKTVGHGTEYLSALSPGSTLDVLTGLGNGYDLSRAGARPLLLGGGVGVPPLFLLARRLLARGAEVHAVLGFNSAADVFYEAEFRALGCTVTVTTADGSRGIHGFVTDALPQDRTFFYACGPEPMLKAVCSRTEIPGQLSLERRMGCGFGACMGCSCRTVSGFKRICREGPVLDKEEIQWES